MFKLSIALALLACAAAPAYAQYDRTQECWNPGAGHFEAVRPGEVQNDLDFSRCRAVGERRAGGRDAPRECWNPGARHFEAVRPGERQDDLDFARCRPLAGRGYERGNERVYDRGNERRGDVARECWNPRAGHYEDVREGERQDDLDFSRCRRR